MKRNVILLQEAYRRDGHADFIKRTSEVCGVRRPPLHTQEMVVAVSNVQIVLPPKTGELSRA